MGLRKAINTSFDVDADYWMIGEEHVDYRAGTNRVVLYGYASKAARTKNAAPLHSAQFTISGADFSPGMSRADIYAIAKGMEVFSGATDEI